MSTISDDLGHFLNSSSNQRRKRLRIEDSEDEDLISIDSNIISVDESMLVDDSNEISDNQNTNIKLTKKEIESMVSTKNSRLVFQQKTTKKSPLFGQNSVLFI